MNSEDQNARKAQVVPDEAKVREENRRLLEQSKLEMRPVTVGSNVVLMILLGAVLFIVLVFLFFLFTGERT